jgi:hypothetical protein
MAQKMQFLAEDVAAAREPTTDELRAWFGEHSDLFALPGRVSFRHLYFSWDGRGEAARDDAAKALTELAGEPPDSERAASLADPFMFQDYYGDRTSEEIAREFGPAFAQAVVKLAPGSWQGPLESGYGWHLVFVEAAVPGRTPAFEELEPDVRTAWLGAQKAEAWRKAYAEMRARYTVALPAPPDDATPPAASAAHPPDALALAQPAGAGRPGARRFPAGAPLDRRRSRGPHRAAHPFPRAAADDHRAARWPPPSTSPGRESRTSCRGRTTSSSCSACS